MNLDFLFSGVTAGEYRQIKFPNDFTLSYKNYKGEICDFMCTYMIIWHWDEDDHTGRDYYFFEGSPMNWRSKLHSLTEESKAKVIDYVTSNNLIEVR